MKIETILIQSNSKTLRNKPVQYYIDDSGCWICISHSGNYGYPYIMLNYKRKKLSRVMYERVNGELKEGLVVMHTCDNPACINPAHLKLGTCKQNSEDMVAKHRNRVGIEHHSVKLCEDDIRYIRSSSKGCTTLARELGVSKNDIICIRHHKTWKHIK